MHSTGFGLLRRGLMQAVGLALALVAVGGAAREIVDGKLYLNFNSDIQATWEKDIPGSIAKAEKNWPALNQ